MQREVVDSSNIKSVGYDQRVLVLEVEFRTASIYRYVNVPTAVYAGLQAAPSKGRFFATRIRDQYRYTRVH